uniref:Uncharacterized protein n=1 Tax=Arundo donax TaxID=35708 RepID=A0A0A9H1G0_ARUDO
MSPIRDISPNLVVAHSDCGPLRLQCSARTIPWVVGPALAAGTHGTYTPQS